MNDTLSTINHARQIYADALANPPHYEGTTYWHGEYTGHVALTGHNGDYAVTIVYASAGYKSVSHLPSTECLSQRQAIVKGDLVPSTAEAFAAAAKEALGTISDQITALTLASHE